MYLKYKYVKLMAIYTIFILCKYIYIYYKYLIHLIFTIYMYIHLYIMFKKI